MKVAAADESKGGKECRALVALCQGVTQCQADEGHKVTQVTRAEDNTEGSEILPGDGK